MNRKQLGVWFPTVKCGTGTDIFTITLVDELQKRGINAEITWLPLRAEYAPWTVKVPTPPKWATLVHVNTWLHQRFLPSNLPIIATLHHSIHDPKLLPYKGHLRTLYHKYWIAPNERYVMQKSHTVVSVSQFAAEIAKKMLCNVPIKVIYNGIDTNIFHLNSSLIKEKSPFRLLYIGSWQTRKGVDLLPKIMSNLGNEFELFYTGGEAVEKDKTTLPKNMYDLGHLSQQQVIHEMQQADALLFPTRSEGFSLVVLEAQACGLPVITTNCSALPESIIHKKTGFLCEENNIESFVTAIRKLKEMIGLRNSLSIQARKHVTENFNIEQMVEKYIEIYKNSTNKFYS